MDIIKNLFSIIIISAALSSYAQQGDDGHNFIELTSYRQDEEKAREYIRLLPGFSTSGHENFHAWIDPDLPFNGGDPVVDGNHSLNKIQVFTPINGNMESVEPSHEGLDHTKWAEQINYFDGLGRLKQEVFVKASPSGADIISPVVYDEFGKRSKEYLSYAITQDGLNGPGGCRPDPENEIVSFFKTYFDDSDGQYPYSEKEFEPSAINRVMAVGAPGLEYSLNESQGHPRSFKYETNVANSIFLLEVIDDNRLWAKGKYDAGVLYKNTAFDENNHKVVTYTNKQGQVVLKQSYDGTSWLKTYYAYDHFGRLRYVIPPEAAPNLASSAAPFNFEQDWILNYCYYYNYDHKGRMTQKRLPGAEHVWMVYDGRDRLILTQDGNMRSDFQWHFTKYDQLNRPVLTGIYNHKEPATQDEMQGFVDTHNDNSHNYAESFSLSNPDFGGYSNVCYPDLDATNDIIHTITYYDNYDCLGHNANGQHNYEFAQSELSFLFGKTDKTKGMVTASIITSQGHDGFRVEDEWMLSVNYYDKYGNLIQTISDNHMNGYDIISSKYNFTGSLLETKTSHQGHETITLKEAYAYDNAQRLVSTTHQVNSQDPVTLHQNTYDELGQLKNKKLHVNSGNGIQQVDYTYNMRGWLLGINDVNNPGQDLFTMKLGYASGDNPQYNGNISSMEWKSSKFGELNSYQFAYDDVDRLKDADYQGIGNFRVNIHNYDKNGNIESLSRYGQLGESDQYNMIDALYYSYEGNQLLSVDDYNGNDFQNNGFSDNGSFEDIEYLYDANGNLKKDLNKNITDISYSYNNLPQHIEFGHRAQNTIEYLYNAAGIKLRKLAISDRATGVETDYTGPFVYENNNLTYIQTSEGRIVPDHDTYAYEYFLKDHLGNTRAVFNEQGEVLQSNSYYPFGGIMEGLNYTAGLAPENKYLYNGKEMQDDFGLDWYDYGFRFYNAQLGRFHTIDPMAEYSSNHSTYAYADNNPALKIDYLGLDGIVGPNEDIGADGLTNEQWLESTRPGLSLNLKTTMQRVYRAQNQKERIKKEQSERTLVKVLENAGLSGFYTKANDVIYKIHIDGYGSIFFNYPSNAKKSHPLSINLDKIVNGFLDCIGDIGTIVSIIGELQSSTSMGLGGTTLAIGSMANNVYYSTTSADTEVIASNMNSFMITTASVAIPLLTGASLYGIAIGSTSQYFSFVAKVGAENFKEYNVPFEHYHAIGGLHPSDSMLKDNIIPLDDVLDKIQLINGYSFIWKHSKNNTKDIGVIAQEIEQVFPELILYDSTIGHKQVFYYKFIPVLIEAIKEQQILIENQQNELNLLKNKYLNNDNKKQK